MAALVVYRKNRKRSYVNCWKLKHSNVLPKLVYFLCLWLRWSGSRSPGPTTIVIAVVVVALKIRKKQRVEAVYSIPHTPRKCSKEFHNWTQIHCFECAIPRDLNQCHSSGELFKRWNVTHATKNPSRVLTDISHNLDTHLSNFHSKTEPFWFATWTHTYTQPRWGEFWFFLWLKPFCFEFF